MVGRFEPPAPGVGDAAASGRRAVELSEALSSGPPAGGAAEGRADADDGRAPTPVPVADGGAAGSGTRSGAGPTPSECSDEERPLGGGPPDAADAGVAGTGAEGRAPPGFAGSGRPGTVAAFPLLSATPARGPAVVAGAGGSGRAGPGAVEGLPAAGTGARAGAPAGGEAPGRGVRPEVLSYWTAAAVPPARAATETNSVHRTAVREEVLRPPISRCPGVS
ncbi:hypothetical protein ACFC6U_35665 [Kitasatospora purpeofusca]|uniref:hypothetical protein n=1 Tax=Kitasatospora purpeofusca TaxID=67352 RepID=UPI0035D9EC7B